VERLLEVNRPRAAFSVAHLKIDDITSNLLIKLLDEVGVNSSEPEGHYRPDPYDIEQSLEYLNQRDDVNRKELARLEYFYINALTPTSKYTFPNLSRELAQSPLLFMQMVALCFRRNDNDTDPDELRSLASPEHAESAAKSAYSTLEYACEIPGTREKGEIDIDLLREWTTEVRKLAKEHGRADITDQRIGHILSHCDTGSDDIWPREEVRQILEEVASSEISIGVEVGVYNSRGAHFRAVDSQQELDLAKKYHDFADAVMNETPFVGRMLLNIARSYERDAEWHDSDDRVRRRLRRL
jgi:hypothetical protein